MPRRNRGDTSMHLGGSVPRSSRLVDAENTFRSPVASAEPFDRSRLGSFMGFSFGLRSTGNRWEIHCATTQDNWDKGERSAYSKGGVSFTADLTKLGHAAESICQSSRPVSIRYSDQYRWFRFRFVRIEAHRHLRRQIKGTGGWGYRARSPKFRWAQMALENSYSVLHKWIHFPFRGGFATRIDTRNAFWPAPVCNGTSDFNFGNSTCPAVRGKMQRDRKFCASVSICLCIRLC